MSPEDFSGLNYSYHPETSGAILEMQRPEQVTQRHLLHVLTTKAIRAFDLGDGSTHEALYDPVQQTLGAEIYRIEKGSDREDPSRVARIKLVESLTIMAL